MSQLCTYTEPISQVVTVWSGRCSLRKIIFSAFLDQKYIMIINRELHQTVPSVCLLHPSQRVEKHSLGKDAIAPDILSCAGMRGPGPWRHRSDIGGITTAGFFFFLLVKVAQSPNAASDEFQPGSSSTWNRTADLFQWPHALPSPYT